MAPQSFSSLYVIPNAIIPYGYEIVPLLGLPCGFEGRFRFSEKWVSEQFKSNYDGFIGKPLFIILRDFDIGNLIPLRTGIVESISKIGETYYISYKLGPLVEFDSNSPSREKQVSTFNNEFFEHHRELLSKSPGQDMKPLVFGTNFSYKFGNANFSTTDDYERDLERFESIISCIKNIEFFKDVQFLKIVDLKELKKGSPVPIKDHHYLLTEDVEYHLRIYQTMPTYLPEKMKEPNDISIFSDSKYINIIQGKKRAVGKYDVLSYRFRTAMNSASARTFLEVHHKTKHKDDQFIEPSFSVPIKIDYSTNKFFIDIFFIFLFSVVYLYPYLIRSTTINTADLIKDLAVIGFAAAVIDLKNRLVDLTKRS